MICESVLRIPDERSLKEKASVKKNKNPAGEIFNFMTKKISKNDKKGKTERVTRTGTKLW